tara:strand:- start:84 stop:713 length:630 start_codon:yes stop_codon:yes gene_type:complete
MSKPINEKGILAKLLEQGIRILVKKECKKIRNLEINITSSSTQIIKGEIQKINLIAEDINYKDLLFDKFELEANLLKINFKLKNKELYFKNNPIIKLKISLSESSISSVLLSNSWNWIGDMISKEILNQEKLESIKIINGQLLIKDSKGNITINKESQINIITEKGRIYLENRSNNKIIQIPMEDKIYVENIYIENNLINIYATSSISF